MDNFIHDRLDELYYDKEMLELISINNPSNKVIFALNKVKEDIKYYEDYLNADSPESLMIIPGSIILD